MPKIARGTCGASSVDPGQRERRAVGGRAVARARAGRAPCVPSSKATTVLAAHLAACAAPRRRRERRELHRRPLLRRARAAPSRMTRVALGAPRARSSATGRRPRSRSAAGCGPGSPRRRGRRPRRSGDLHRLLDDGAARVRGERDAPAPRMVSAQRGSSRSRASDSRAQRQREQHAARAGAHAGRDRDRVRRAAPGRQHRDGAVVPLGAARRGRSRAAAAPARRGAADARARPAAR